MPLLVHSMSNAELRSEIRAVTFQKGTILTIDGIVLEHVTVQNLSRAGARLVVRSGWDIPDDVVLEITARHERHQSKVRWRLSAAIGVLFTDRMRPISKRAGPDVAVRLLELEQEVGRLSAQNQELLRELAAYRVLDNVQ
jgi:hypothetical protein